MTPTNPELSNLKDKICIVTGSNSGIGKETALALAEKGARVVMVVRNSEKGENARVEIIQNSGNESVDLMICDLASLESIRHFTTDFKNKYDSLHVLVNNAGAVFNKRQTTVDGFEQTLAVNYLAPFLLIHELLPLLQSSSPSRVINLTSGVHKRAEVNLEDLQSEQKYKTMKVYGSAKLLVILFTYEIARRLEGSGVTVNAVSPGFVATNLGANSGSRGYSIMFRIMKRFQLTPKEGAATSVYLATSPEPEGVTGRHFAKQQEERSAEISYDTELQKKLWDITVDMLGIPPDV